MTMNQFALWHKKSQTINPKKAGYSDMRLWPAQLLYYHLIIILTFVMHPILAIAVITVPAMLIAIMVFDYQSKAVGVLNFDHAAYENAARIYEELGLEVNFEFSDFPTISAPSITKQEYFASTFPMMYKLYKFTSRDRKLTPSVNLRKAETQLT